jgi:hypothetical protein
MNLFVQVLLLVWDDTTNNMGLHSGLMATHDQETLEYFKVTAAAATAAADPAAASPAAAAEKAWLLWQQQ